MRPKAYSQALGLTASAFFGTTIRSFDDFYGHLVNILHHSLCKIPASTREDWIARLAGISFYLLFFRSIHGIFSYDGWIDQHETTSLHGSLDRFSRTVAIITPPLATLVGPFLIFHELANHDFLDFNLGDLIILWVVLFVAYLLWDLILWLQLVPSTSADLEFHAVATNWVRCDALGLVSFFSLLTVSLFFNGAENIPPWIIFLHFISTALAVVIFDYVMNYHYFFDVTVVDVVTRECPIKRRAYEIYLERNGRPGSELEDWLQAEREHSRRAHGRSNSRAQGISKQQE